MQSIIQQEPFARICELCDEIASLNREFVQSLGTDAELDVNRLLDLADERGRLQEQEAERLGELNGWELGAPFTPRELAAGVTLDIDVDEAARSLFNFEHDTAYRRQGDHGPAALAHHVYIGGDDVSRSLDLCIAWASRLGLHTVPLERPSWLDPRHFALVVFTSPGVKTVQEVPRRSAEAVH